MCRQLMVNLSGRFPATFSAGFAEVTFTWRKFDKCTVFEWRVLGKLPLPPAVLRQHFCWSSELSGTDSNYTTSADVTSEVREHSKR